MRPVLVLACLSLSLGGCEAARSAFGAINVFGDRASAETIVADEDRASRDDLKALPGGLIGDTSNVNHLPETLQPVSPM